MAWNNSQPSHWSIAANWIIPVDGPPIRDGVLRMQAGRVEAVGPRGEVSPAAQHEELGALAVLPGLVNAHCHLELSELRGRLPAKMPMIQWLFALMQTRDSLDYRKGARQGAMELLASGCTTVGDVSHDNGVWPVLKELPLRKVCFAEVLGVGPLASAGWDRLEKSLQDLQPDDRLQFGLSPHAPYSTNEQLYRRAIELASRRGMPVTTHLAETKEERIFLHKGTGMFREFLARMGLGEALAGPLEVTPIGFAQRVGLLAAKAILAHVNYIDQAEMDLLSASQASVAYCPRSSEFFGRAGHGYPQMLRQGINVCLGTDSLASNTSLDMLAELRAVWAQGQVDAPTVLRMGTLNGARALGLESQVGSLTPGKWADWIALPCPGEEDPLQQILRGPAPPARIVIAGQDAVTKLSKGGNKEPGTRTKGESDEEADRLRRHRPV